MYVSIRTIGIATETYDTICRVCKKKIRCGTIVSIDAVLFDVNEEKYDSSKIKLTNLQARHNSVSHLKCINGRDTYANKLIKYMKKQGVS